MPIPGELAAASIDTRGERDLLRESGLRERFGWIGGGRLMRIDSFGCAFDEGCNAPLGGASDTLPTSPFWRAWSTALCPLPSDDDCVGDGGGRGDAARGVEIPGVSEPSMPGDSVFARLVLEPPLVAECIDPLSEGSLAASVSIAESPDGRGLSERPLPGILDRMAPRNDRADSFVSDLLSDGYDLRISPARSGEALSEGGRAPSGLDAFWPMF